MQKTVFLCLFSIWAVLAHAQDKIITINQDTIQCRIMSIGAGKISYEQETGKGYMHGQSIPIDQVVSYFRMSQSKSTFFSERTKRPWLFRFNPGGSWMPWLLEDVADESNYGDKLSKGFHLNASGHYLLTPFVGVGIQYSFFHSKADGEYPINMSSYPYSMYTTLSQKEKQYINYVGPSIIFQQFLDKNKKFKLSETLSTGVIFYRAESQASTMLPGYSYSYPYSSSYSTYSSNTLTTGRTLGATLGISAEYFLSPSISIGLGGDFLLGWFKKVDIKLKDSNKNTTTLNGAELDNSVNISRVDYSLGLSFYF